MRAMVSLAVILLCASALLGCAKSQEENTRRQPPQSAASGAQKTAGQAGKVDYDAVGAELMKDETVGLLRIGLADNDVIMGLGEPTRKSDAKVYPADGCEHQRWYYPANGIELDMIRKEGKQVIKGLTIKSPCKLKTKRGIGIGSTSKAVLAAYKNEINPEFGSEDGKLVAGTVYGGIIFGIRDGAVACIFGGAAQ